MNDEREICAFCAGVGFMAGLASLFLMPFSKPLSKLCAMFSAIALALYVIWNILNRIAKKYAKMFALQKCRADRQESITVKSEDCDVVITKIVKIIKDSDCNGNV